MTTIREVAKRAGVSTATVSRVINGLDNVQEKTKKDVEQAMIELRYHPNRIARSLKVEKSQQIGVVLPHISNQFFMEVTKGIEDLISPQNYSLMIASSDWDEKKELQHLETFSEQRVRALAVISVGNTSKEYKRFFDSLNIPYIFADRYFSDVKADFVLPDNIKGVKKLTKHLLELGHINIGFIDGYLEASSGNERIKGFEEALDDSDIDLKKNHFLKGKDYSISTGYELTRQLLNSRNITALISGNNTLATGALLACREMNVKVPQNLSLVSFGDLDLAPLLDPPLTVATNSGYDMGKEVGRLLLERLYGENTFEQQIIRIPSFLKIRSSTAAIKAAGT